MSEVVDYNWKSSKLSEPQNMQAEDYFMSVGLYAAVAV